MKRKVRITPPASNPFESNSMSTWMAQLGGTQPTSDEHITSIAAEMLSQGFEQNVVKQTLSNQGYPLAKVNEIIDALVAYVDEQRDLSEASYLDDELAQQQILADQEAAEREALEDEELAEDVNEMYYAPDFDPGYAEEDAAMQDILMKYGGKIPTKKQFIKQELKRKQEGGLEESNKADDTMSDKRPVNTFIQKVSAQAQQKADEEALEEQYNQMFGNQELPEAQFGGFRNPRRAQRQMNRQVNRMIRNTPMGFFNPSMQFLPSQMNFMTAPMMYPQGFGIQDMMNPGVQMANIQVRRTGLFGRPKEYTINFNTTPPSQINPREIVEQEIRNIGETVKEKEEADKEKETTTASTENETVQDELVTADQIEVVDSKGKGKTTVTPQIKSTVKRDLWGRPEGDKWYGYDPDKKIFTNQVSPVKGIIDRANLAYDNSFKPASSSYSEKSKDTKKAKPSSSGFNNPYLRAASIFNSVFHQQGGITGYDLYKFTGGGDDSMIPFADESFRNNSVDTTDPYFEYGGLIQAQAGYWKNDKWNEGIYPGDEKELGKTTTNTSISANQKKYNALKELGYNVGDYREGIDYSKIGQGTQRQTTTQNYPMQSGYPMMGSAGAPIYPPLFGNRKSRGLFGPGKSIQYAGSWLQQQGLPYDPRTGKPVQGLTNQQIKSIDVKKSGLISGRPKKYTINFTGQAPEGTGFGTFNTGFQPRKDWNTPQAGTSSKSNTSVPGAFGPRSDEFMQNLWKNRAKRKGYDVDWSTDGMISPKDLQPSNSTLPAPQFTDKELGFDKLVDVQPEIFAPQFTDKELGIDQLVDVQPEILNQSSGSNLRMPEFSDAELNQGMIDVQPEDLSQYANQFSTVGNLPLRRPYSAEQAQMLQNFAPYMGGDPYSTIADLNSMNTQDFELERLMNQDRSPNTFAGNMADYNFGNPNTPINMPGSDPYNAEMERQEAARRRELEQRAREVKNDTRKEVNQSNITSPKTNAARPEQQKLLNRISQIQKELSMWQPDWIKESLQDELRSLSKGDWRETPTAYRQTGGVNFGYPQLPVAQTLGQFNMRTPSSNRNYATMPSAEDMMQQQTPMGQFANYQNPLTGASPAIRMGSEGEYINEGVLTDEDLAKLNQRDMSIDAKVKNMYNVDFENLVNQFNAGAGLGLSMLGQFGDIANNQQLNANLTSGNVYNAKNQLDKGDYTQWGQFRPDRTGFKDEGMTTRSQKGGSIYKEGGETYMSAKQITDFLANGGEIEFV